MDTGQPDISLVCLNAASCGDGLRMFSCPYSASNPMSCLSTDQNSADNSLKTVTQGTFLKSDQWLQRKIF